MTKRKPKKPVMKMFLIAIPIDAVNACVSSAIQSRAYGIHYWADTRWRGEENAEDRRMQVRESTRAGRLRNGPWHNLRDRDIQRGMTLMSHKSTHQLARLINGNADASTGDMLIQLAVLGKIKYG